MNPKVVSDMVIVLDEFMPCDLYALDFTQESYRTLLKKLNIHNEILFNDKKGAIKKALCIYFTKTYQEIEVELSMTQCTLQQSLASSSGSEPLDRIIFQNRLCLIDILKRKAEFSLLPHLISIPEILRSELFQPFVEMNQNFETARQVMRQQIDKIFDLDQRDIVLFIRGRITIRNYIPTKKIPAGMDKRFAGESPELMAEMYTNNFPDGAWLHIEPALDEVIAEKLNFSIIDNHTFSRTCIPVFRTMIEILLLEILNEGQRDKIEGFSGYVLRQHFQSIFLYTAKNLLQFVENRDKNTELFIKYYADEIIIDANGNKVQKYAITDTKNQKWNYSSILSIMMQYKQMKLRISAQKEAIHLAQTKISESQAEIESEKDQCNLIGEKVEEIESLIVENDGDILKLKSKAKTNNSNHTEIQRLNNLQDNLFVQKKSEKYHLELSKGRLANKKIELVRRNKKLFYEQNALKTLIEQTLPTAQSYEQLAEVVALTLAKR